MLSAQRLRAERSPGADGAVGLTVLGLCPSRPFSLLECAALRVSAALPRQPHLWPLTAHRAATRGLPATAWGFSSSLC